MAPAREKSKCGSSAEQLLSKARELRAEAALAQQRRMELMLARAAVGNESMSASEEECMREEAELTKAAVLFEAEAESARVRERAVNDVRATEAARQVRELRVAHEREMAELQANLVTNLVAPEFEPEPELEPEPEHDLEPAPVQRGFDCEEEAAVDSEARREARSTDDEVTSSTFPDDLAATFPEIPWSELSIESRCREGDPEIWRGSWRGRAVRIAVHVAVAASEIVALKAISAQPNLRHVAVLLGFARDDARRALVWPWPTRDTLAELDADNMPVRARSAFRDVLAALDELDSLCLVHRGVSLSTVGLVDRDRYVLFDFELARPLDGRGGQYFDEPCGLPGPSLRYAAPEIIQFGTWSAKSDVWAAAVVCWRLVHRGAMPFADVDDVAAAVNSGCRLDVGQGALARILTECFADVAARPMPADALARLDALPPEEPALIFELPLTRQPSAPPWRPSFDEEPTPDETQAVGSIACASRPRESPRKPLERRKSPTFVQRFQRALVSAARHYTHGSSEVRVVPIA